MPLLQHFLAPNSLKSVATQFDWDMLTWGFGGGLLVVALAVLRSSWELRKHFRKFFKQRDSPGWLLESLRAVVKHTEGKALPAGARWTFSDSWATNLTALITTIAAITAIFGKDLEGIFQGNAPLAFSLTTSVMLFMTALAPVVYTVFQHTNAPSTSAQRQDKEQQEPKQESDPKSQQEKENELQGTMWGWCLSAGLTLFAVGGSLTAAMRFVFDVRTAPEHRAGQVVAWVFISLVIWLVVAYVVRSFLLLVRAVRKDTNVSMNSLVGMVTVSCCSGTEGTTRVRISLL